MSDDKKELKDKELEETKGGMKIFVEQNNNKLKKYILDIINKIKNKK